MAVLLAVNLSLQNFCRIVSQFIYQAAAARRREEIIGWFPFLRLEAYDETFYDVAFPVGRSVAGIFRFRRAA